MEQSARRVKGLGEVSIFVNDLDAMQSFYEEVVGLKVLRRDEGFVFFKIAEGYAGHSQNLALFDANDNAANAPGTPQISAEQSTLHHIALNIALEDYESEKTRLESLGLKVRADEHEWLHVRSLYFSDPEGNTLEFVCFDPGVGQADHTE